MWRKNEKSIALLTTLRPLQWIKNGFVLAPLLFSSQFHQLHQCLKTVLAFTAFCIVSSAIYVINDLCDRRMDRQHPVKKLRPIASGVVTSIQATILAMALTLVGIFISIILGWKFLSIVVIYLIITIAYSLGLKHVVILDVMIVASGFVLRILGGSMAIAVEPSHWLVLCTILISLFLGFTKRRAELVNGSNSTESYGVSRIVLNDYSIAFLDQIVPVVAAATIVCYSLYTVDARTLDIFGTRAMLITIPCVIYGLFRYIYIIYQLKEGEDPTRTFIKDIPTIINIIIWIILSLFIIVYGGKVPLFY